MLGLILHAELRLSQALPCYWCFMDLEAAFDNVFVGHETCRAEAGITGIDWLLLDDIMDQDSQCVAMRSLLSRVFRLGCGTAQGRRFTVHVFSGLLRWLFEEVHVSLPHGTKAWFPPATALFPAFPGG